MSSRGRLLTLFILLVVTAVCVRLGFWQLARLEERRADRAVAEAARELPEFTIVDGRETGLGGRHVVATGIYDRDHELILRGQAYREAPGVFVVTPLRLSGSDAAVLVLRGFVPAPDAVTAEVADLDEPGVQTVRGVAQILTEREDDGALLERTQGATWRGLDRSALAERLPYPLAEVYVIQSPDSALPRSPRRVSPPPLDDGPHLSYAIQWFAFATIAVVGGTVLLGRKRSEGRGPVP